MTDGYHCVEYFVCNKVGGHFRDPVRLEGVEICKITATTSGAFSERGRSVRNSSNLRDIMNCHVSCKATC